MNPLEIPLTTYLNVLGIIKYDVSKSYGVKFILKVVLSLFLFFRTSFQVWTKHKPKHKNKKKKTKATPSITREKQ